MSARVRQVLSDKKLRAYSQEHVYYELTMMFNYAILLEMDFVGNGEAVVRSFRNAIVEAFALHVRNVVDFFYPSKVLPDDVIADDFMRQGGRPKRFPKLSPLLARARVRANKEVNHLTTGRRPAGSKRKRWPYEKLCIEVDRVLTQFLRCADPKKLSKVVYRIQADVLDAGAALKRADFAVRVTLLARSPQLQSIP